MQSRKLGIFFLLLTALPAQADEMRCMVTEAVMGPDGVIGATFKGQTFELNADSLHPQTAVLESPNHLSNVRYQVAYRYWPDMGTRQWIKVRLEESSRNVAVESAGARERMEAGNWIRSNSAEAYAVLRLSTEQGPDAPLYSVNCYFR